MKRILMIGVLFAVVVPFTTSPAAAQSAKKFIQQAKTELDKGNVKQALRHLDKAIKADRNSAPAYLMRANVLEVLNEYKNAARDYSKVIDLQPNAKEPYQRRGVMYFKMGRIKESIRDFDQFIKREPAFKPRHWQRGISYYYAKEYKKGQRQFEGYQTYDSNDVENAVWRYLCMVPLVGKKKARQAMLKIGEDKRIPMRQIYDLFLSKLQPNDIVKVAQANKPNAKQLNERLFYAHLYIGLFYESEKKPKQALEHLQLATKHRIGHYMWDVARVHRDMLHRANKKPIRQ